MKVKTLFKDKLVKSSIRFTQDTTGGVIWVKSIGEYPITTHELKRVLESYKKV